MPSLTATPRAQQPSENIITKKTPPLSTLIRKRAHQQFESIGSTQAAQSVEGQRNMHSRPSVTEPRLLSRKDPMIPRASIGNASSLPNKGGQRTLRSKASTSALRPTSSSSILQARSLHKDGGGIVRNESTGKALVTSTTHKQPQIDFKKRDVIMASPVMSAMLQSHRAHKLTPGDTGKRRSIMGPGEPSRRSIIEGGGIKVKSAITKAGTSDPPTGQAAKILRVKLQSESNSSPKMALAGSPGKTHVLKATRHVQSGISNGRPQSGIFLSTHP